MNTLFRNSINAVALAMLLILTGCAGMSERDQDTALGAGAGAVAGAVITGGSPVGTLGGAAVGGLIGRVIGEEAENDD
jgi:osmotically inducible lipoprotein OsmB